MKRLRLLVWNSRRALARSFAALPHDVFLLDAQNAGAVRRHRFDCIVFQHEADYLDGQYEFLTPAQRRLPRIYVEHEPPWEHPVDSRHVVTDADVLVVHLAAYNRLMWDHAYSRDPRGVRVIAPGIADPGPRYRGRLARAMALADARGRRAGSDLFAWARERIALDLLPAPSFEHRVLLFPARQATPPVELIEAMAAGTPVAALATGEMPALVRDGENGLLDLDAERLLERTRALLADPALAARLGAAARRSALERFGLARFVADWNRLLAEVTGSVSQRAA